MVAGRRKKSGKFEAKIFILCSKEGKMEDPLKRNFGLITWRGKNFIAAAAAAAPVHRPLSRPPDYLRRRRNGLTSIFCLASRHTSSGRGRDGGGGLSADFGSCDDFHFSGLIESVSSAIAALIEWAYLTDLSAGAELTYLPFVVVVVAAVAAPHAENLAVGRSGKNRPRRMGWMARSSLRSL